MARLEWRDRSKERFWRQAVQAWQKSGLTIREFCARRSVAEHNFHAWRRTLAERDRERETTRRSEATFVPVEVVSEAAALEIALPGGAVVRVRAGCDPALLRQVLATLREEPSC